MSSKSLSTKVISSLLITGAALNTGGGAVMAAESSPACNMATAAAAKEVAIENGATAKRPHMDVAFCIDTTGSMQGEIDMVKKKTKELVAKLSSGKPAPVVRIGLVAYRDIGDAYVTKVFPFSDDIDQVVKDISNLKADGGGDGPEAVDRGLHAAIRELRWNADKHTAKLLFLIGDAGPHQNSTDLDWRSDCRFAIKNGIQINTMGCSGLESYPEPAGVGVFKEIAKLTDGKFESLAYKQEVVDAAGKRSVVIHSGGVAYRARPGVAADGASWKSAVAKGMMEAVPQPVPASMPAYAPSMAAAAAPVLSTAVPFSVARRSASSSMATGALQREENNLDELMFEAAKQKAAKTLHVGY
ncbi:MAG TPA: vWA domain-containing protein [Oculatellaceae cyanobacterium]